MRSNLLINEPVVAYLPSVAKALGITDSLVVQQMHYWLLRSTKTHEGHAWVFKSAQELAAELGMTYDQVRRAMERQRETGVLIAIANPTQHWDRTLWWRIDHEVLDGKLPNTVGADAESSRRASRIETAHTPNGVGTNAEAIPETTSQTTHKDHDIDMRDSDLTARQRADAKLKKFERLRREANERKKSVA